MNKTFKHHSLLLLSGLVLSASVTQAQTPVNNARQELDKLLLTKQPADSAQVDRQLSKLAASNQEAEMMLAAQYYYRLKNTGKSDSLVKLALEKFPNGVQARAKAEQGVYDAKTGAEKEILYRQWIKKFPPESFPTAQIDDRLVYDYARSAIASRYAEEKNVAKADAFANMLEVDFWKGNAYAGLTQAFLKNGDLVHAEIYAKKAMDSAGSYLDGQKGDSNAAKFAASGYPGLTTTYANILFDEKKYNEALKYSEMAYQKSTSLNPQLNYRYAQILEKLGHNQEAYDKLEQIVKAGKATPEMAALFKTVYVKVKGSDAGFNEYAADLHKSFIAGLKTRLTREMLNEKAATFTLTDLNGKEVSLQDYKGKIVVLDFWATWCGPCKASFPAMQMAANKYKNDPNVQFLFIHTWERSATAKQDASAYIKSMNYKFEVLMDLKDPATKENKVVSSYKVVGIPAKFVVDAEGNIRFKLTGFDGSNEAAVEELSMMIEMARKSKA
ncbi:redoxin domain-containing protein [Mucilaginibacter robiniae]|uniref:Redoxin domain-containing protein n=1 Tax=Mucilaginibacter robiniae TaxID=2728022 RepID=A0A7L5DYM6_9SPHI|nr:redoxin domain-containing protein [Mucilaginibacter robiniae]QJD96232.1 redoxin domain-containing protein [Mucilaginibacter robiniae]